MQKLFLLLEEIIKTPVYHAKFLNTLSLLEYSGAQKLVQTSKYIAPDNFFLEHLYEEFRHAYFLRSLAQKIHPNLKQVYTQNTTYNYFASKNYFTKLNTIFIKKLHKQQNYNPKNNYTFTYYLTTYLIEQRALKFYISYQNLLTKYQIPISLKSIISEEEHHLQEMHEKVTKLPIKSNLLQEFKQQETQIFALWSTKIQEHMRAYL